MPRAAALRAATTARVAELLDAPPAVGLTSSCTHALEAAALLLGIGPGDEVVVPAFAFSSTANPFLLRGATLRFADVDPRTANLDPASVADRTGPRTRAVVCVHYGGVAADLDRLVPMAADGGWDLVEDAAQGLFGSLRGRPLGRFGRLGALSFHHTKNISAGDGGALVVNDPDLAATVPVLLDKGNDREAFERGLVDAYEWSGPGSSWRMPDAGVARLSGELDRREAVQAARHRIWDTYARELADWAPRTGARLPLVPSGAEQPAHLFWVLLPPDLPRDRFVAHCAAMDVVCTRHYGSLPRTRFGRTLALPGDECPVADSFAARLVRLPLSPDLGDDDVERVLTAVTTAA
ncbi:MAG: DegT/DnrJ/EryC1/StrS family aminotransferase [Microthrixaceae bacterium]